MGRREVRGARRTAAHLGVQTLSLGVDGQRGVRPASWRKEHDLDRASLENAALQQSVATRPLEPVSASSEFAEGELDAIGTWPGVGPETPARTGRCEHHAP